MNFEGICSPLAISTATRRSKLDDTLARFTANLAHAALLVFVVLAALAQLGVQTTSFVAVIGAAGLAVGLALQGSLSNFAAGALIILFKPYKAGDHVEGAGKEGTVEEVQIFTTVLNTPDNRRVIVPNSQMMNGVITNISANDTRRVDLTVGVSHEEDLQRVKELLTATLAEEPRILEAPAPMIAVQELADSSTNLVVRPWVRAPDYWPVYWNLTERLKERFREGGVSLPFPRVRL